MNQTRSPLNEVREQTWLRDGTVADVSGDDLVDILAEQFDQSVDEVSDMLVRTSVGDLAFGSSQWQRVA